MSTRKNESREAPQARPDSTAARRSSQREFGSDKPRQRDKEDMTDRQGAYVAMMVDEVCLGLGATVTLLSETWRSSGT